MIQYDSNVERVKIFFESWIDDVLKANVLLWSVVIFDFSLSYSFLSRLFHHIFDLLIYYFISYEFTISFHMVTKKYYTSRYIFLVETLKNNR